MNLSSLLRWDGTVGRGAYALTGLLGFGVKHNLDRWIASTCFERPWSLLNYWDPQGDPALLFTLLFVALPFIWVGVGMTARRLRDLGLPSWMAVAFFLPVVNLVLFLLLSILPSRHKDPGRHPEGRLAHWIPKGPLGSAALATFIGTTVGLPVVWLGTSVLASYGWGLFVGVPFCTGLSAALIHGYHRPRSLASCLGVAVATVALLGIAVLAVAIEGAVCLFMAMPIGVVLAALGGWMGFSLHRNRWEGKDFASMLLVLVSTSPLLMGAESAGKPPSPVFAVTTYVDIVAPTDRVWERVISFPPLPEPRELIFRAGVAYPVRAEIQGVGIGAVRHCVFSTGAFVEPITAWEAPCLLKFSVTENPEPMTEWSPWGALDAPHLHGFLVSKEGQFKLIPLPGGRTRLEGTTWYQHGMWPSSYWRLWSDAVIHRIHLRVLNHVKELAEEKGG